MLTSGIKGASTGGTDLISCSNVTRTDTSYCCDHQAFCCDTGVARFDVLPSNPQVWATYDARSSRFLVQPTTTSSSSTASILPSILSAATTTTTTASTSTNPSSTAAAAASSSTQQPQPTTTSSSSTAAGLPVAAQAGIGVGAGVLAVLLAAVTYLLWKLRRNKRRQNPKDSSSSSNAAASGGGGDSSQAAAAHAQGWYYAGPKELPSETARHEMDGTGGCEGRAEMPVYGYHG